MKINVKKDLSDHELMAVSGNVYLNMFNNGYYLCVDTGRLCALVSLKDGSIFKSVDAEENIPSNVEELFRSRHAKPEEVWKDVTDSVSLQIKENKEL